MTPTPQKNFMGNQHPVHQGPAHQCPMLSMEYQKVTTRQQHTTEKNKFNQHPPINMAKTTKKKLLEKFDMGKNNRRNFL